MKKILFPTDCSAGSRSAFAFAVALAQQTGAHIDIMSVYHLPAADASSVPPAYIDNMIEERRRQVLDNMDSMIKAYPGAPVQGIRADYGVFTHQEIVDVAADGQYDLIVMGTHGVNNALDRLLGSVTTQTVMQAPCPVLAIPPEASWHGIRNIAYATDFHPADEQAVSGLRAIADVLGARLHLIHIQTRDGDMDLEEVSRPEYYLPAFAEFAILHHSSVMEGLEKYLKEKEIDVLTLFIPRRRIWERLFHTSFSKKMMFHTQIPLLSFRA
jgi:nucleotide-binding universal stress UspA family protein